MIGRKIIMRTIKLNELIFSGSHAILHTNDEKTFYGNLNNVINRDKKNNVDELYEETGKLIIRNEKASVGFIQRTFRLGFNRACRIMDQLAEDVVVGPEEATKSRQILMTMEQFEKMLKQMKNQ